MNDFDKAAKKIGNRFDLVLVASERMREIHNKRRAEQEEFGPPPKNKKAIVPAHQAITDIENGKVGIEYLQKIKHRTRRRKAKLIDKI